MPHPDGRVRRANLGDGTHVYHVADLTPLVEPGSAAAEALERSARRRQTAKILNYVGGGIMLSGASLIGLAGVAAADERVLVPCADRLDPPDDSTPVDGRAESE